MRDEFVHLVSAYPKSPAWRAGDFKGAPIVQFIENDLPAAIRLALGERAQFYDVQASAGKGDWTHTPWVVLLDPAVTASVEEGFYVVYLLSKGGERLYLTLNQGCTTLNNSVGRPGARAALASRAQVIRDRVQSQAKRLKPLDMDLNVDTTVWRGRLYERGVVLGVEYKAGRLPTEEAMHADLAETLDLYHLARMRGGWEAEDVIIAQAVADGMDGTLQQAKRYRQHRAIERQPSHSQKVKKALGTRCMGCEFELSELYGDRGQGIIDAHHLTPLASLEDGSVVTFDPRKDFAVLCPNCHRVIHKMPDPGDLAALRAEIARGPLAGSQTS